MTGNRLGGLARPGLCVRVRKKACDLARAISRRALIAHGVKKHPFEIRIGDGGVRPGGLETACGARARVCELARAVSHES